LGHGANRSRVVEDDGAGTGRALIQCQDERHNATTFHRVTVRCQGIRRRRRKALKPHATVAKFAKDGEEIGFVAKVFPFTLTLILILISTKSKNHCRISKMRE
jgi:hypothetical protein